jgi:D-amino-acid dehydrogenase
MRVAVLGAGVAGIATAYHLQERGHEVTVIERQSGAALETSFSNAGHVGPSYATPWAAPGMKLKAVKWIAASWLLRHDTPIKYTPRVDSHQWAWLARWLGECNAERYLVNKARMGRIARYSHAQMQLIRSKLNLNYEQTTRGNLQVFRDQAGVDNAQLAARVLKEAGVPHQLMSSDECAAYEPALARDQIAGGMLMPSDETGNCQLFTSSLATWLQQQGVAFRYATHIEGLRAEGSALTSVATSAGAFSFDAYVLSCASTSVTLARPLGLKLPILPVKGYAITAPITDAAQVPRGGIMDEALKVAIAPMGDKLRAAGVAHIGANDTSFSKQQCATTLHSVATLFPKGVDLDRASYWAGLRPMTPDGAPIVGATRYRNLFLATGGGSNGWTTACGVGRVVSEIVSGKAPEIESADLGLQRFG